MRRVLLCAHDGCDLRTKTMQSTKCELHDPSHRCCPICNSEFKAKASNQAYCSKECQSMKPHTCRTCSVEFLAVKHNRKYCSIQCKCVGLTDDMTMVRKEVAKLGRMISDIQAKERKAIDGMLALISSISANSCKECGQLFVVAARRKVYCSSKCGDKEQNRVQKHRRAARKKGVRHENVSASKVFEAAGWKCSACRKETPKSERGKHNHNSPELDHIMPLSKGGSHTYDNTQCLCRQCNALKSDNIWHVAKG